MNVPDHGRTTYPWRTWTDGRGHTAIQGRHFGCDVEVFRRGLFVRAKRVGMVVTTRVLAGGKVWFRFAKV